MSITTSPSIRHRKPLSATVARGLAAIIAAAWRSRTVPQDGEHPSWCMRPAKGCQGAHARGYETGRGHGATWHLSARLPIGADEGTEARIHGPLIQREADWAWKDAERMPTGSLLAKLELSVSDARALAHDLLRTVHHIEAGIPMKHQSDQQA